MDKHLQQVLLAALDSLKATLYEGSDVSYLEGIIDPSTIGRNDIRELQARIEGLRPERLVVHLEDGMIQSVYANNELMSPTEVYILDLDTEGADHESVIKIVGNDDTESEACFGKWPIIKKCYFDVDKNIRRLFN